MSRFIHIFDLIFKERNMKSIVLFFLAAILFSNTCCPDSPKPPVQYPDLAGSWKNYSARVFYDQGGGGALTNVPEQLRLTGEGKWTFGTSSGSFFVSAIDSSDWTRWNISAYGPTRKISFSNWKGSTADGPIEESNGRVNFVWVIYKVAPPIVSYPGAAWLKFGHP